MCLYNKKNITRKLEDMNFMFSWQEQYLYCNSLYLGLPDYQIQKIQRVQNAAARLEYNAGKYWHITPLLFKLHWLPIRERILFKILLITYKAVHGHAPNYIKEFIKFKKPAKYNLR